MPDTTECFLADTFDGDSTNEDEMFTNATKLGDIFDGNRASILDAGQQIEELKGEMKEIQYRTAALETWKGAQELAKVESEKEFKELKELVNEFRDTMRVQAERINTLNEENKTIREDLANHQSHIEANVKAQLSEHQVHVDTNLKADFAKHEARIDTNVNAQFATQRKSLDNKIQQISSNSDSLKADIEGLRSTLFNIEEKTNLCTMEVNKRMGEMEKIQDNHKEEMNKQKVKLSVISRAHGVLSKAWVGVSRKRRQGGDGVEGAKKRKDRTSNEAQGGENRQRVSERDQNEKDDSHSEAQE
jgi:chromosome segregation ATPase